MTARDRAVADRAYPISEGGHHHMETNPYQAPPVDNEPLRPELLVKDASQMYIDGDQIIVRSGCVLPFRCVKTSQPVSACDMVRKDFYWCPPLVLGIVLILLGPLLMFFVYLGVRKKCALTYGVHPSYRKKHGKRLLIKSLVAAGFFAILAIVIGLGAELEIIAISLVPFLVAFIAIFVGNSPIRITKHRKGAFWVKGCSPEFLKDIQEA